MKTEQIQGVIQDVQPRSIKVNGKYIYPKSTDQYKEGMQFNMICSVHTAKQSGNTYYKPFQQALENEREKDFRKDFFRPTVDDVVDVVIEELIRRLRVKQ